MSFTYSGTSSTCSNSLYNPLSDPSDNITGDPSGNWSYWLYKYSGSGNAETISFKPKDFLNSSGDEDKDYYMCLISQGGSGGPAGLNSYVDTYDGYTYNLTAYGGSGGGGGGGQVYTNSFSTNSDTVTVTLYPCGKATPSQYSYNGNTIKVAYGYSGVSGGDGVFNENGRVNDTYGNYNMTSVYTGGGGAGGNTSNTGSGGDSNTSIIYRYGGAGGNGGGFGPFSNPLPDVGIPMNYSSPGAAGSAISIYGGPAYGGTNGSPGEQNGSIQGAAGATTVNFLDGTSATIAAGGLGGYGGTYSPQSGQAGNSSAFMFYYSLS